MSTYKFQVRKGTPLHEVLPSGFMQSLLNRRGYDMRRMVAQPGVDYFYITTDNPLDEDMKKSFEEICGYKITEEGQSLFRRLQFWR